MLSWITGHDGLTRLRGWPGQCLLPLGWPSQHWWCPGKAEPNPQISTIGLRCRGGGREEELVRNWKWALQEQRWCHSSSLARQARGGQGTDSICHCKEKDGQNGKHGCFPRNLLQADRWEALRNEDWCASKDLPPTPLFLFKNIFKFLYNFKTCIYYQLFLTALGLHCCEGCLQLQWTEAALHCLACLVEENRL